ncbi:hypothetical protein HDV62DRAFT_89354 [Trichoderma sp. SZMC 28011]
MLLTCLPIPFILLVRTMQSESRRGNHGILPSAVIPPPPADASRLCSPRSLSFHRNHITSQKSITPKNKAPLFPLLTHPIASSTTFSSAPLFYYLILFISVPQQACFLSLN